MKDFLEQREDAATRQYEQLTENVPDGCIKCPGCHTITMIDDMHHHSPDPYAMPICGKCMREKFGENWPAG